MTRAGVALGAEVVFFASAFGWRSWVQWRRTGSTGFIRPRRGAPPAEVAGSVGFVAALVLLVAAPLADAAGMARIALLDVGWAAVAGATLGLAGIALTLVAQVAMGDSWRIGVDGTGRTDLVTTGVFARVRNPVFTAMVVATVGLFLLVPSLVSASALVVLVAALEVQVRFVEEPHLARTHGPAYERYRARTGRFLPALGAGSVAGPRPSTVRGRCPGGRRPRAVARARPGTDDGVVDAEQSRSRSDRCDGPATDPRRVSG